MLEQAPAMRDAVRHWPVGEVIGFRALSESRTTFEVSTAGGPRYVLKDVLRGHEFGLRMERLCSEHRVLAFLRERGLPVPHPLLADTGETFLVVADEPSGQRDAFATGAAAMVLTLYPMLPDGSVADNAVRGGDGAKVGTRDPADVWRAVGTAIGRLHAALAEYPHTIPSYRHDMLERFAGEALPTARALLTGPRRAAADSVFGRSADEVRDALTALPEQYIHGDCHGGNILIADGAVSGFIDLDHLPFGQRVYDLCYLLANRLRWSIYEPGSADRMLALLPSLISGYQETNPLSERERQAVWPGMLATLLSAACRAAGRGDEPLLDRNLAAITWASTQRDEVSRRLGCL